MTSHQQLPQEQITPRYKPYHGAAGGWGALRSVAKAWVASDNALKNIRALLKTNQNPMASYWPGCPNLP
ncbi:MAG: hypothetical protein ACLGJA_24675, partial [Gammaproteobacteria bacterium]